MSENVYLPKMAEIVDIKDEIGGPRAIKTYSVRMVNKEDEFDYECGQCAMLSIFGRGEAMISICSSSLTSEYVRFSVMKSGRVTMAMFDLNVGDYIGIRAPLGNCFPINEWKGKNLLVIGGGIGIAPVWSIVNDALGRRDDFGDISLYYGARSSEGFIYKDDIKELKDKITVNLSIDVEEPDWDGYVGFVPANILDKKPSPENTIAVTCGPPIMIKFVIQNLEMLGFSAEQIYTTIENKMKCGIGKCGRCNVGKGYVCTSGPVYSWAQLKELPQEY
jgi:NAD(P)H-flavin reductase